MDKLVREVGNWVMGDRFWDRENELRNLTELLDDGANILITGQRRMGKTSLIREVGRRLEDKYLCLQLDIQKHNSPADVIADICIATRPHLHLWEKTKEIFRNIASGALGNIDSLTIDDLTIRLRDGLSSSWQERGERVIAGLAESEKPVIMFIDEFPLFIIRILKGEEYVITPERLKIMDLFMSWIRSLTITYRRKLCLVLAGSIGLEPILRQARLSATINTFTPFEVPPWDQETASGCLYALADNYRVVFEDGVVETMLELLGYCIPHHVQMFFSCMYDDCKRRNDMHCTQEDAHRLYKYSMLSTRGHAELSTYEERLKIMLGTELMPLALEVLTEAAVSKKLTLESANILCTYFSLKGQGLKDALREILGILEHDGYLKLEEDYYVFISKLVRDWWEARFGFQFIKALERRA